MRVERTLHLRADADGARDASVAVRDLLAQADPDVALQCELAVCEACANVAEHGYAGEAGPMRLVLRVGGGVFGAAVCDEAPAFDGPANVDMPGKTAEGGRGLALLELCMHRLIRRRVDGENRLLMVRSLRSGP